MKDSVKELNCRREKLGLSWKEISERTQKDQFVIMRQLADESNPTLETLELYANVLGGTIHFVPNDWQSSESLRNQVATLSEHNGALTKEIEMLRKHIDRQDSLLRHRLERIDELQKLLTEVIHDYMEKK